MGKRRLKKLIFLLRFNLFSFLIRNIEGAFAFESNQRGRPNVKNMNTYKDINWSVKTEKLEDSVEGVGYKSVRRSDDQTLLGVVSNSRAIVQPSELLERFENACSLMGADFSDMTIREIHGGSKLHFEAPAESKGEFRTFACVRASFDSTERFRLFWRFVDEDGLSFVGGELVAAKFTKNHSLNFAERNGEAEEALLRYPSDIAGKLKALSEKVLSTQKIQSLTLSFIGKGGKRKDNEKDAFKAILKGSKGIDFFKACLRFNDTERSFKQTERVSREENKFIALTSSSMDQLIELILK